MEIYEKCMDITLNWTDKSGATSVIFLSYFNNAIQDIFVKSSWKEYGTVFLFGVTTT